MPVVGLRILVERHRDHGRHAGLLDPLRGEERFPEPRERLRDHEVWVFLELSLELLVEQPTHLVRGSLLLRIVHPREAEVRRDERSIARDLAGEADRGAVDVAHPIRIPDRREFLLARIEGEGLQDFRAGVKELLMELPHGGRMLQDDFRREGTGLNVAAFLEFE